MTCKLTLKATKHNPCAFLSIFFGDSLCNKQCPSGSLNMKEISPILNNRSLTKGRQQNANSQPRKYLHITKGAPDVSTSCSHGYLLISCCHRLYTCCIIFFLLSVLMSNIVLLNSKDFISSPFLNHQD